MSGYGIAEWFGEPFAAMSAVRRRALARAALGRDNEPPPCPFQPGRPACKKRGGVCSIQAEGSEPVVICPRRFEQGNLLPVWLARIAGFDQVYTAREVPFMRNPETGKAAGRVDLIVANDAKATEWYGLEIQAVYFSGRGMDSEFETLLTDDGPEPPAPAEFRRPDWRSSSAKRPHAATRNQSAHAAPMGNQIGRRGRLAVLCRHRREKRRTVERPGRRRYYLVGPADRRRFPTA